MSGNKRLFNTIKYNSNLSAIWTALRWKGLHNEGTFATLVSVPLQTRGKPPLNMTPFEEIVEINISAPVTHTRRHCN
jgi:hypothetical protein